MRSRKPVGLGALWGLGGWGSHRQTAARWHRPSGAQDGAVAPWDSSFQHLPKINQPPKYDSVTSKMTQQEYKGWYLYCIISILALI